MPCGFSMVTRFLHPNSVFWAMSAFGVLFILNSYPFMFPGYDMWWHMGAIDTAQLSGPRSSGARHWHKVWSEALSWLPATSFFDRALIVHRVQFFLAVALVGLSGYWILRAIFHRSTVQRAELLLSAWVGVLIWLVMHGTYSQAVYGGLESRAVMSWISWYSINYQIALSTCLLAGAALLYAVGMPLSTERRMFMLLVSTTSLLLTTLIHAAEVPYFLFAVAIVVALYVRGRTGLLWTLVLLMGIALSLYLALRFSYRTPELLRLTMQGDWGLLADRISRYGQYLVVQGANRRSTGWNTLYTVSALLICASLFIAWRFPSGAAIKPMLFVLLTGLMPLMLLFQWSAGLLAIITYANLAWRFAFSSYLFLAIPIFLVLLGQLLPVRAKAWGQVTAAVLITLCVYAHSRWVDSQQIVNTFAASIVRSTDPRQMYFDLSTEEQEALDSMHARLIQSPPGKPLCVDVFSAYYLFFLKDFREVYVPGNVNRLPIVEHRKHRCRFPRDGGDLVALGIKQPPWRFRLAQDPVN